MPTANVTAPTCLIHVLVDVFIELIRIIAKTGPFLTRELVHQEKGDPFHPFKQRDNVLEICCIGSRQARLVS